MADVENKHPENVDGPFYVDDQCIDCDLCRSTAPDFYGRADGGYSFLVVQPTDDDQIAHCQEAADACPVEAIGNDGG